MEMIFAKNEDFSAALNHAKEMSPIIATEIISKAKNGSLMVESENGDEFYPIFDGEKFSRLEPACYDDEGLARHWHKMHVYRAAEFRKRIGLKSDRVFNDGFNEHGIFFKATIYVKTKAFLLAHGMNEAEAALELGLTLDSFKKLKNRLLYHDDNRYYADLLEAFRNIFLPHHKSWSSRTSLLMAFIENYNSTIKNDEEKIHEQMCEISSCNNIAIDRCINPTCNGGNKRYICSAHCVWVKTEQSIELRPKSICPICNADSSVTLPRYGEGK